MEQESSDGSIQKKVKNKSAKCFSVGGKSGKYERPDWQNGQN